MSTKHDRENLASVLFGKTRRAVLGLFYGHPDEAFYLSQVTRRTGAGKGAVQREVNRLAKAELLTRDVRGREVYYQANRECPIFSELHRLVLKTVGLADVLRYALEPLKERINLAFIYGSQADGQATAASDVDLLVVGPVEEMGLHRAVQKAEKQLARAVNYTLMSKEEFVKRRRENHGFLARVIAAEKILIVGDVSEV